MPSVYSTTSSNSSIYEDLGLNTTDSVKEAASQVKDQTLTQEDFLMLLTTQLQAQDPTNPADNTELVSQMSQLSMVESLNSINSSMDGIIEQVKSSSALNATSLIGTYVYTDSNKGFFDGSNTLSWAIDAGDETYYDLELTIKDASSGQVVYRDSADALTSEIKFAWPGIYSPDGPVETPSTGVDEGTTDSDTPQYQLCAAGKYILEVTGKNAAGETISLPVKSLGLVTSVTLGNTTSDTMLSIYGSGEISFEDAKKVTI